MMRQMRFAFKNVVSLGLGGLMLAVSLPAFGQSMGQGNDAATPMWRVLSALILCIVLAFAGAWAIKTRFEGRVSLPNLFRLPTAIRSERRLLLQETLRLNPQTSLSIVSCDGRELLIATSGNDVKLLEIIRPAGEATDRAATGAQ